MIIMVLAGHTYKEIKRKVKSCIIEDGLSPDACVKQIEEAYELDEDDRLEIKEMAKDVGK
jgi:hypothetical protein